METQCPYCKQVYDIEDEAAGHFVDCLDCGKSFLVEPFSGKAGKRKNAAGNNGKTHADRFAVSKPVRIGLIAVLAVMVIAACAGFGVYYLRPNATRAVGNRADVYYLILDAQFEIHNKKAVRTMCEERAKLELKEAEKREIVDAYVSFWCDRDVLSIMKKLLKVNDPEDIGEEELKRSQKEFQEILDTRYPQSRKILGITDVVEKECSPMEKIVIKHEYGRSRFMLEQEKKRVGLDSQRILDEAEEKLAESLFLLFMKESEIDYPDELRAVCRREARKLFSNFHGDSLAVDWAKLILSEEFDQTMRKSIASSGTSRTAFSWLEFYGEKQIAPLPYGNRMETFLMIDDVSFWNTYYKAAKYGEDR